MNSGSLGIFHSANNETCVLPQISGEGTQLYVHGRSYSTIRSVVCSRRHRRCCGDGPTPGYPWLTSLLALSFPLPQPLVLSPEPGRVEGEADPTPALRWEWRECDAVVGRYPLDRDRYFYCTRASGRERKCGRLCAKLR